MSYTEMIILRYDQSNNSFNLTDYFSTKYQLPTVVTQIQLNMTEASFDDNRIFGKFSRLLNNSDPRASKIGVGVQSLLSFAYKKDFVTDSQTGPGMFHDKSQIAYVLFGASQSDSSYFPSIPVIDYDAYDKHGDYMTVAWVGIIQLAIIVMRYFKQWMLSGFIHSLLGLVAFFITLISAWKVFTVDSLAFYLSEVSYDRANHSRIGLTICAITMTQLILGIYTKISIMYGKKIRISSFTRQTHQILGWATPVLALINVKLGWLIHEPDVLDNLIYPFYGILITIVAILEIRHRFSYILTPYLIKFIHKVTKPNQSIHKYTNLVEKRLRSHVEILNEIKINKRQWVFYDDLVLDVSGFKYNHPGGAFVFNGIYGEDAGKFVNGCSSVNEEFRPYTHSQKAKGMIPYLVVEKVAYPSDVLLNVHPTETLNSMNWILSNNVLLSSNTHCLEFMSLVWNLNPSPPGYEWIGKHFLVTYKANGFPASRYYSFVAVNLGVWADEATSQGFVCKEYNMSRSQERLRLHLKEYPGGLLSPRLCNLNVGSIVNFKGPLGPGLCIESIENKEYLILGAGTGILPFLDLIYKVWLGNVPNACFYVYMSFRREEESFALDLVQATAFKYPNQVKFYSRVGQAGFQQESEFWKNIFPLKTAEKAWVCGPPAFNRKVQRILSNDGMEPNKIILL